MILFLDYHNILWYYHHVIVFCATPIQAFQSVSEPHTLLSLYFSQQHHYAAEQWAVDFFVFEGTFSPTARMTPAMPSAGASIREDQDVILAFLFTQRPQGFGIYLKGGIHMSRRNYPGKRLYRYREGDRRRQKLRKTERKAAKYRRSYTRVVPHQTGQRRV